MNWGEILDGVFIQEYDQRETKVISELHKFNWSHVSALNALSLISGDCTYISA